MKIITSDYKKGFIKVIVTDSEDLWNLSQLISEGDEITSRTTRLVKTRDAKEGSRVPMTITIKVEKSEWSGETLRILGVIKEGPEDAPRGSHHSINIEVSSELRIIKDSWSAYDKELINRSLKVKDNTIIITLADSSDNYHAVLTDTGLKIISNESSTLPRKDMPEYSRELTSFYKKTISESINLFNEYKAKTILFAGPGFAPEDLKELMDEYNKELSKKCFYKKVSTVSRSGFNELIKGGGISDVLKESRILHESRLVNELLTRLKTEKLIKYGLKEVREALKTGAGETLLISQELIKDYRNRKEFKTIENILYNAEEMKTSIEFISSNHELGERFHKLGGIALMLRYQI